jgi:hypothetical protein
MHPRLHPLPCIHCFPYPRYIVINTINATDILYTHIQIQHPLLLILMCIYSPPFPFLLILHDVLMILDTLLNNLMITPQRTSGGQLAFCSHVASTVVEKNALHARPFHRFWSWAIRVWIGCILQVDGFGFVFRVLWMGFVFQHAQSKCNHVYIYALCYSKLNDD